MLNTQCINCETNECAIVFCVPTGTFDNREHGTDYSRRPVGTNDSIHGRECSAVPSGLYSIFKSFPTDESVGYCQLSLRDKMRNLREPFVVLVRHFHAFVSAFSGFVSHFIGFMTDFHRFARHFQAFVSDLL